MSGADRIEGARELEKLRYTEALGRLNEEEREQIQSTAEDLAKRGTLQSGHALLLRQKIRVKKLSSAIEERIDIRRHLTASVPELGSAAELDGLLAQILQMLQNALLAIPSNGPDQLQVQNAIKSRAERDIESLKHEARNKIEILKRESALNIRHNQDSRAAISIITGDQANINLGTVYGDLQQEIGKINKTGNRELAELISELGRTIRGEESLAEERTEYLEQLNFIAEQIVQPPESRRPSVVKGVLAALRARLQDVANIAQILGVAGPAIAHHFGFPWP